MTGASLPPGVVAQLRAELAAEDERARRRAANGLAALGTDEAFEVLWQALSTRSADRAHYLANAIGRFGAPAVAPLAALAADSDPNLRSWAAWGLGVTGDQAATAVLERIVATDHAESLFFGEVSDAARVGLKTHKRLIRAYAHPDAAAWTLAQLQVEAVRQEGLGPFVDALCRLMDNDLVLAYLEDEHERYWLYWSVRDDVAMEGTLFDCLRLDPEPGLAASVLWPLLDCRGREGRHELISRAPLEAQDRLRRRAMDLDLRDECLEAALEDRDLAALLPRVLSASDWVQLAVVDRSDSSLLLEGLATNGRTRRIRGRALHRLRRSPGRTS